ncbi:hypothetical protein F2Q69_00034001 [Brassica cretica]|uniref:Uncharacterized protein n=1 Tax=Brassica cretica TaxID=69181 RepID=A0A8S9SKG4_BRACR|nr:hypothetical protein F2Q69_00034001 [Brassica cretica]
MAGPGLADPASPIPRLKSPSGRSAVPQTVLRLWPLWTRAVLMQVPASIYSMWSAVNLMVVNGTIMLVKL